MEIWITWQTVNCPIRQKNMEKSAGKAAPSAQERLRGKITVKVQLKLCTWCHCFSCTTSWREISFCKCPGSWNRYLNWFLYFIHLYISFLAIVPNSLASCFICLILHPCKKGSIMSNRDSRCFWFISFLKWICSEIQPPFKMAKSMVHGGLRKSEDINAPRIERARQHMHSPRKQQRAWVHWQARQPSAIRAVNGANNVHQEYQLENKNRCSFHQGFTKQHGHFN